MDELSEEEPGPSADPLTWMLICISKPKLRFAIHYNLQDMYMHTRPPFVLQGMVALPSFIILDFCVCWFGQILLQHSSGFWLIPIMIPGLEQKSALF